MFAILVYMDRQIDIDEVDILNSDGLNSLLSIIYKTGLDEIEKNGTGLNQKINTTKQQINNILFSSDSQDQVCIIFN